MFCREDDVTEEISNLALDDDVTNGEAEVPKPKKKEKV